MYSIVKQKGVIKAFNLVRFLCDTETDIAALRTDFSAGSIAYCVENGTRYVLNNQHTWVEAVGGSGGGGSIADDLDIQRLSESEIDNIINNG